MLHSRSPLVLGGVGFVALLVGQALTSAIRADDDASILESTPEKVTPIRRSLAEWKKQLTTRQFEITRLKETDPAYSGRLWHAKRPGVYRCVCCELEVFRSTAKYDSHTGWPSFWKPARTDYVTYADDASEQPARVEVMCARCGAHLGHVFGDGPPPTGHRYCINSTSLHFVEAGVEPSDRKSSHARAPR
jgi:peptide-methionine (R)-S-oxide reductase